MTSVYFKCKCPCVNCRGTGPTYQWICPYCGCKKLFTDQAKIVCTGCRKRTHFIWKASFKCGNGGNGNKDEDYHEISYQGLLVTLSAMGSIPNPPVNFLKKVTKQCMSHADEFLDEEE